MEQGNFFLKFRRTMGKVKSHLFEFLKLGPYITGSREIVYQGPENLETWPVRHFQKKITFVYSKGG